MIKKQLNLLSKDYVQKDYAQTQTIHYFLLL